jgi:hypothetical protein
MLIVAFHDECTSQPHVEVLYGHRFGQLAQHQSPDVVGNRLGIGPRPLLESRQRGPVRRWRGRQRVSASRPASAAGARWRRVTARVRWRPGRSGGIEQQVSHDYEEIAHRVGKLVPARTCARRRLVQHTDVVWLREVRLSSVVAGLGHVRCRRIAELGAQRLYQRDNRPVVAVTCRLHDPHIGRGMTHPRHVGCLDGRDIRVALVEGMVMAMERGAVRVRMDSTSSCGFRYLRSEGRL